jgi:DNA-binding NarL/FixJ family response regulator
MTRPRVLLADDHGPMLARVVELVAAEFDVVAAVSDGQSAVDAAAVLQPDRVVFDISMPIMSGLAAAAHLAESAHPPRIVFLTVHDDPAFVDAARTVGALGYVIKRRIGTDLMPAIHLALEGLTQFPSTAVEPYHHPTRG